MTKPSSPSTDEPADNRSPEALRVVWTTVGNHEDGSRLARELIRQRLAACVQVDPIMTSIYRWNQDIEQSSEHRVVIKTTLSRLPELSEFLERDHPYEVPQIIVLPVEAVSEGYERWIIESLRPESN
ncbi:MAG: divalent-cation tolerance protein CutA [Planctomycetota bacterium]